jgi:hypothetical protein
MKTNKIILIVTLGILLWTLSQCHEAPGNDNRNSSLKSNSNLNLENDPLIDRGEYLVTIMGCDDCHSPKQPGPRGPENIPDLRFSGYPSERPVTVLDPDLFKMGGAFMNSDLTSATGPWGTSFAGNISSDATGIGNWTLEQFKKALTEGKYKGIEGTRMLLPPMPWQNYTRLKEEDLQAIYLFLQSTKPVKNIVPAPIPPAVMIVRHESETL